MRSHSTLIALGVITALSAATALGCSGRSATASSVDSEASALDAPNGGVDPASTEEVAFGDPAIERLPEMSPALADLNDVTVESAQATGAKAYRVVLLWGHLPQPHDADDTDPTPKAEDWTGTISVDAGAVGVKRTIAFDANDKIDPRTSPTSVSFTSHTLPYVDGVLLRVVVPSGGSSALHFATPALTTDIDLSQLDAKIGGVQRLADDEEGLAWIGFSEDAGCARGFVHGRWTKDRARLGKLRGIVSDADGARLGHVRGLWGHAVKRNADVFFGKYIGNGGEARGLFLGKYGGALAGVWGAKDEQDVEVGHLEGFYSDGYDKDDGRGVWLGRWEERCTK